MSRFYQILVVTGMVFTWAATLVILTGATNFLGRASIAGSGIASNVVLGIVYSYLKQRPASFREWLHM